MADLYVELFLNTSSDEIRLIQLKSGTLEVQVFAIDQAPSYVALSYAWKEDTDHMADTPSIITIYAKGVKVDLTVQPNLWLFLKRAKQQLPVNTYLWIDALCINQRDVLERSHQVGLMKSIYSRAILTIVWLGENSSGTLDMSYLKIRDLTKGYTDVLFPPWSSDDDKPSINEYDSWVAKYGPRYSPSDPRVSGSEKLRNLWVVLDSMCREKRYWSRLWVVQEFTLSKRVCIWIGNSHLELSDIAFAVYKVMCLEQSDERNRWESAFTRAKSTAPILGSIMELCIARFDSAYTSPSQPNFEQTFNSFSSGRFCTESYDAVYALLSLCREPITSDYSKSLVSLFWEILELPANRDCVGFGQKLYFNLKVQNSEEIPASVDMDRPRFHCKSEEWHIEVAASHLDFSDDKIRVYAFSKIRSKDIQPEHLHLATKCTFVPTSIRHIIGSRVLLISNKADIDHSNSQGMAILINPLQYQVSFQVHRQARLALDGKALGALFDDYEAAFSNPKVLTIHQTNGVSNLVLSGRALGLAIFCDTYAAAVKYGERERKGLGLPEIPDDE